MAHIIVEIANITLLNSKTEQELLHASDKFQKEFVSHLEGFINRELVHLYENQYADIIHWENRAAADTAMQKSTASVACQEFFSIMDMENVNPDEGLTYYKSLASYKN